MQPIAETVLKMKLNVPADMGFEIQLGIELQSTCGHQLYLKTWKSRK